MLTVKDDSTKKQSPQIEFDSLLAWKLQVKEYKKHYARKKSLPSTLLTTSGSAPRLYQFQNVLGRIISFALKPTPMDGDCFFYAVDRLGFTRNTLVEKLLDNPTQFIRSIFAQEIRQFLYLGYAGFRDNEKEDQACQQLLGSDIKILFLALQETEKTLRLKINEARYRLGEKDTHEKKPLELLALLKQEAFDFAFEFEEAYQGVIDVDNAIYQYCCREKTFKEYVQLYLKEARGYIPFSRDFSGGTSGTTIDAINQLFGLKIQVYLPADAGGLQLQLANQLQTEEVIPIFHNGINHFWGLVLSPNCINMRDDLRLSSQSPAVPEDIIIPSKPTETSTSQEYTIYPRDDLLARQDLKWIHEVGGEADLSVESLAQKYLNGS